MLTSYVSPFMLTMMKRQAPQVIGMLRLKPLPHPCTLSNKLSQLNFPCFTSSLPIRNFSELRNASSVSESEESWLSKKFMNTRVKLGLDPKPQTYYRLRGLQLYGSVECVNWKEFFRIFQMPDTFLSWFLVMELHMWMVNVRANREGREGDLIKKFSVIQMWEGAQNRAQKLGAGSSSVRESLEVLHEEFVATFLMYDYGLLTSDAALASALWYRFLQQECTDPEKLELLVKYVRKQLQLLNGLSREDFIERANIQWLSVSDNLGI